MYLPKSILYPLVILFTLGGVFSFYFEIKQLAPTHILLQNNVKVNLDLLLEEYKPKLLIADGSNDPWFSARWEKTCKKYNVRFYDTRKNGALKINLENEG